MSQELDPASVSIRRGLGGVYAYARRYEQARYHTERAIAMNPLAEESYRLLGMALFRMGRTEEAERVLRDRRLARRRALCLGDSRICAGPTRQARRGQHYLR
jgi:tetratricopeptide (TPR) repeat protein